MAQSKKRRRREQIQILGLHGPLSKKAALEAAGEPTPAHSWCVEIVGSNGQLWRNGVTFWSKEEAEAYAESYARDEVPGYVKAEILTSDEAANCSMFRLRRGGPLHFGFTDGECHLQEWKLIPT
jgi:hypothetical protein